MSSILIDLSSMDSLLRFFPMHVRTIQEIIDIKDIDKKISIAMAIKDDSQRNYLLEKIRSTSDAKEFNDCFISYTQLQLELCDINELDQLYMFCEKINITLKIKKSVICRVVDKIILNYSQPYLSILDWLHKKKVMNYQYVNLCGKEVCYHMQFKLKTLGYIKQYNIESMKSDIDRIFSDQIELLGQLNKDGILSAYDFSNFNVDLYPVKTVEFLLFANFIKQSQTTVEYNCKAIENIIHRDYYLSVFPEIAKRFLNPDINQNDAITYSNCIVTSAYKKCNSELINQWCEGKYAYSEDMLNNIFSYDHKHNFIPILSTIIKAQINSFGLMYDKEIASNYLKNMMTFHITGIILLGMVGLPIKDILSEEDINSLVKRSVAILSSSALTEPIEVCEWIKNNLDIDYGDKVIKWASYRTNIDFIKWCCSQKLSVENLTDTVNTAVSNIRFDILGVLDEHKIEYKIDEKYVRSSMQIIVTHDNVAALKYYAEKKILFSISDQFVIKAITSNSMNVLRYLIENNIEIPPNPSYIDTIILNGSTELLGIWIKSPYPCIYDQFILDRLYHNKIKNGKKRSILQWWINNLEQSYTIQYRRTNLIRHIVPMKVFGEIDETPLLKIIADYAVFYVKNLTNITDPNFQGFLLGTCPVKRIKLP